MRFCRRTERRGLRGAGIALLILGLVPTPLPRPDYHNIRHHDGPGEVCEHHDHLLRWHPGAGRAEDVAVLHWHWFLLSSDLADPPAPSDGPSWHAHVAELSCAVSEASPRPALEPPVRAFCGRLAPCPLDLGLTVLPQSHPGSLRPAGTPPPTAFCATFAPRVSLARLLQRWAC